MRFLWLAVAVLCVLGSNADAATLGEVASTGNYSQPVAFHFLDHAYAAYCNVDALYTWSCKYCKMGFVMTAYSKDDSQTDTVGYVGYDKTNKQIIVSFRGTNSSDIQNWIVDMNLTKSSIPFDGIDGAYVHGGFYLAFNRHILTIEPAVRTLMGIFPDYSVWITGHSLGAAVAQLTMVHFARAGIPNNGYNFGSPRVGNSVFARNMNSLISTHYRLVHDHDIVPHGPLKSMGYRHSAIEVWEHGKNDAYKVCDNSGEDPTCSDSLYIATSVSDHLDYMGISLKTC